MKNKITFCIVNDIDTYANDEIKRIIKNIFDYTVSNLYNKGYKILTGVDEDDLLRQIETDYAVVMSPGTEYINGNSFFESLERLIEKDFFLAGHILDRSSYDAYYELHHQCYVINLKYYRELNYPVVGKLEHGIDHYQKEPLRSDRNHHDDYTPLSVSPGNKYRSYKNRCHGWNLLRLAFENDIPVIVFDETLRNNKKHYYPEIANDFYKHLDVIKHKLDFCQHDFVHVDNTESSTGIIDIYQQVVIPASGTLYLDLIENGRVIFYDYNQKSLEYWKENCLRKDSVEYFFVHSNLLESTDLIDYIDEDLKTLINLSNVFCYEGTAAKYSLRQRLSAQNNLVNAITNKVKDVTINFSIRADDGHR